MFTNIISNLNRTYILSRITLSTMYIINITFGVIFGTELFNFISFYVVNNYIIFITITCYFISSVYIRLWLWIGGTVLLILVMLGRIYYIHVQEVT